MIVTCRSFQRSENRAISTKTHTIGVTRKRSNGGRKSITHGWSHQPATTPIFLALSFVLITTTLGIGAIMADSEVFPPAWGLVEAAVWEVDLQISTVFDWQLHPFQMDRISAYWLWASGMGPPPPIHIQDVETSSGGFLDGLIDFTRETVDQIREISLQLLPIGSAEAATFNSAGDGNWNADATWTEAGQPGTGDHAIITAGHTVTLSANDTTGSVQILGILAGSSNELICDDGGQAIIFDNDGELSGNLKLTLTSGTNRTIDTLGTGGSNILELKINSAGVTFTLATNTTIASELYVTDGKLDTSTFSLDVGSLTSIAASGELDINDSDVEIGSIYILGTLTAAHSSNVLELTDGGYGDIVNNDGTISGTVDIYITSTTGRSLDLKGSSGNFNDMEIDGDGDTFTLANESPITVDGNWTTASGDTVDTAGLTLDVAGTIGGSGNWIVGVGSVTAGFWHSSVLVTVSTGTLVTDSNDFRPNAVTVTDNATVTVNDQLGSNWTITDGKTPSLTCKRTYATLTFTDPGNSTVTVNAGETWTLKGDLFYNLIINNSYVATMGEAIVVENDLTINSGATLSTSGTDYSLQVDRLTVVYGTLTANGSSLSLGSGTTAGYGLDLNGGAVFNGGTGPHTMGSFYHDNAAGTYQLTSNTTTIDSEYANYALLTYGGVGFDANGGTILITTGADTRGYFNTDLNNLEIDSGYTIEMVRNTTILGTLVIDNGTFDTGSDKAVVAENVTIGDGSGAVSTAKFIGNASVIDFNSLTIDSDGEYDATTHASGTVISGESGGGLALAHNGTLTANSGLIKITITTANTVVDLTGASGIVYDLEIDTGIRIVSWQNSTVIDNDLTISGGSFIPDNIAYTLEVGGDVDVTGTLGKWVTTTFEWNAAVEFYSLTIQSGGEYDASSGTTEIDGDATGWALWCKGGSTLTHNDGLLLFSGGGTISMSLDVNAAYDVTYTMGGTFYTRDNPTVIENDLTLDGGTTRPLTVGDELQVDGTTTINNGATLGYDGNYELTLGILNIANGGILEAPDGDSVTGLILAGSFTNNGSFIHNDGTVYGDGGATTGIYGSTNTQFYNVAGVGTGVGIFRQYVDATIEHDLSDGTATGGVQWQVQAEGKILTLGTSSYASQITNEYFDGAGGGTVHQYVYGANQLYPAYFSSDIAWLRFMGASGSAAYMADNAHVKWVEVAEAITTPSSSKTLILEGDASFAAVTVQATDTLDLNGKRAEITGLLDVDGTVEGGGLVLVQYIDYDGSDWTEASTTDLILTGTGGTDNLDMPNVQFRTLVYDRAAAGKFVDQSGAFGASTAILGSGTLQLDTNTSSNGVDLTWASGSTLLGASRTIRASGDLTASGGLLGASALDFERDNSEYVDFGTGAELDITSDLTLEFWYKPESNTVNQKILISRPAGAAANDAYYFLGLDGNPNKIYGGVRNAGTYRVLTGPTTVTADVWHHLAFVFDDSADMCYLYLDGKLEANGAYATTIGDLSGENVYLGGEVSNNSDYADGVADDVRIWNDARTEAEIRGSMFSELVGNESGLVGYWNADEGTGSTLDDLTTSDNDGTASADSLWAGSPTFTYSTSTVDMTGDGTITYPDQFDFYNLTVGAATKTTSLDCPTTASSVLQAWGTVTLGTGTFTDGPNNIYFILEGSASPVDGGATFTDITRVRYKNTIDVTGSTYNQLQVFGTTHDLLGDITVIGNLYISSGATLDSAGFDIDTVNVDSSSGALDLTNGSTITFTNTNGFQNSSGTLTGAGAWAASFDGSDDQIHLGTDASLDFGTNDFSMSFWFYSQTTGLEQHIVNRGTAGGPNGFTIRVHPVGALYFRVTNGANSDMVAGIQGGWHHAVLTCDRDGNALLYVDNVLGETHDISGEAANAISQGYWGLGAENFSSNRFKGSLADVRLFDNDILTVEEIATLYNSGSNPALTHSYAPAIGTEAGWWKLDEADMPTDDAADSSANTNTGTVTGAKTNEIRIDGGEYAATFDGTDDEIVISDHADFDITDNLTASIWAINDNASVGTEILLSKYTTTGDEREWAMFLDSESLRVQFGNPADGTYEGQQTSDSTISEIEIWHHYLFTFSGGTCVLYMDGVLMTSTAATLPATLYNGTSDVIIGNRGGTSQNWDGKLVDARIFDSVLSAGDIALLAGTNPAISRSYPTTTATAVGWWKLDEADFPTDDATDSAGSNDGTVTGATSARYLWDGDAGLTWDLTRTQIFSPSSWGTTAAATNLSYVTLTNVTAIKGDGILLEWFNSTFNPEAITIPNSGRQISRNHNVSTDWLWWGIANLSDLSSAALPDGNSTIILKAGNLTADLNATALNLTVTANTVWIQGSEVYSYYSISGGVYVEDGGLWNLTGNLSNRTYGDRLTNQSSGRWTLDAFNCDTGVIRDFATLLNCNNLCALAPYFVDINGNPEDRVYYSPDDVVAKGTEVTIQVFANDPDSTFEELTCYLNWHRIGSLVWENETMNPGTAPPPGVLGVWTFPRVKDIVVVYEFNITINDGDNWIYTANRTIEWIPEGQVDGGGPGGLGGQDPGGGTAAGAVAEGGVSALICLPIIFIVTLAAARLTGFRRRVSP